MPTPENKPDLQHIAGYVAAAPEVKQGNDGEFTTFRVGVSTGYGDDGETRWYSVAINNTTLQQYVQENISKGTPVVVEGITRIVQRGENTYYNFNGYRVGKVDWFVIGNQKPKARDDDF
jgi:hypothetical protein